MMKSLALQQPRASVRLPLWVLLLTTMMIFPAPSSAADEPRPWWHGDATGVRVKGDVVVFVFVTNGTDPVGPKAKALSALHAATRKDLEAQDLKVMTSTANEYIWGDPSTGKGGRLKLNMQFVGVVFFTDKSGKKPEPHESPKSSDEILLAADLYFVAP